MNRPTRGGYFYSHLRCEEASVRTSSGLGVSRVVSCDARGHRGHGEVTAGQRGVRGKRAERLVAGGSADEETTD